MKFYPFISKLLHIIFFITLCAIKIHAQSTIVFGTLQDAFLKTPLTEATVDLMEADSTTLIRHIEVNLRKNDDGSVRSASFTVMLENKKADYVLRASAEGYTDAFQPFSIDPSQVGVQGFTLGLQRSLSRKLDEVVVTATKVKMYYKGDTLVYDASAFKLPDGSMLDDLIRQMPGVTMNEEGEIFVNGRKVEELLLGSRSFMRGNKKILMENLPYYTVKDVKVYEQQSDLSRALGRDNAPKKYVMDVNLKPEFSRGYIANAEAAGGTEGRWLARAFLLGFEDKLRLTLFGNANNVNESRHVGQENHWTPAAAPRSLLTTRSVAGEIDWQSDDQNTKENLTIDYSSTKDESEMNQRRNLFIDGQPWQTNRATSLAKANRLKAANKFSIIRPHRLYLNTDVDFNYTTTSGNAMSLQEQGSDTLTTRLASASLSDGREWGLGIKAFIAPSLKPIGSHNQGLWIIPEVSYMSSQRNAASRYDTNGTLTKHNSSDYMNRKLSAQVQLSYEFHINKKDYLTLTYLPSYSNTRSHDWLYHPDTLLLPSQIDALVAFTDPANSYDSHHSVLNNNVMLAFNHSQYMPASKNFPVAGNHNMFQLSMMLTPMTEWLDYQRGEFDTHQHRNLLLVNPKASLNLYIKRNHSLPLNFSASYATYANSIIDCLPTRDDATPLVVRLGNPDLKNYAFSTFTADFRDMRRPSLQWNAAASLDYHQRDIAQTVTYDPKTSVYTYRPDNISGTYTARTALGITWQFDKNRLWTISTNADANYHHSLDHSMLVGETESRENAVNTLTLHNGTYIQYNKGALNVRATGDIRWRHSEGKMRDFSTLNALDYQYGLSARYTIPRIKTTISVDGKMFSRRGYGSKELNTDDFVLNASISQSLLKGKLIARIEAFDLLHQLSSTQYEVNAQGRIETWYRSLPHYVMAHVVYHWNKNPKKR